MRLAGYLRISVDDTRRARLRDKDLSNDEALSAAIERQREDCRAALEDLGWHGPVDWYVDRDRSAFNEAVERVEFERLLADLTSGKVTHVIVYHPDRLARQPLDLERMLKIYRRHAKAARFATAQGEIDPRDEYGAKRLRWEVENANSQSIATARRVKRKHLENARKGIPVGGTRPFGWQDDKRTLEPDEAKRLRQAVADVLSGKPLASVTVEWQEAGLRTTRGNEWTRWSLLKCLTNPRIAGYSARNVTTTNAEGKNVTRLEVVRDIDGKPVRGVWEPIITPEEWEAVCAALATKAPRPGTGGTVTKYLLSGIARCGKCGKPLRGIPRSRVKPEDNTFAYLCAGRASGGCGGVSRDGRKVDEYVTAALVAKMRKEFAKGAVTADVAPWSGADELAEAEEAVSALSAALGGGKVTSALIDALAAQEARVRRLERERGSYLAAKAAAEAAPVSITAAEFAALPFPSRRKIAEDRLAAVFVDPMPEDQKRRGKFLPELLRPVWR